MTPEEELEILNSNRAAWDRMVLNNDQWTVPVSRAEISGARSGKLRILLTPGKPVPAEWLHPLKGKDVLCLAGGGGQQAPLLAAAGANVTTLDNSPLQLNRDEEVAARENLEIRTVLGRMSDLSALGDSSFDLIVHPCSNCFAPRVRPVWNESFRVLRSGGHLLSGFNNPLRFIFDYEEYENGNMVVANRIPYSDRESLSEEVRQRLAEQGEPLQFGHSLQDQIGGQLDAGFLITGFYEDDWADRCNDPLSHFIDSFIATRATKPLGSGNPRV